MLQVGTWSHDVLYVPRYLVRPAPCEVQLVEAANRPNTYYVSTVVAALEVRGGKDKERRRQAAKLSRLHSRASREKKVFTSNHCEACGRPCPLIQVPTSTGQSRHEKGPRGMDLSSPGTNDTSRYCLHAGLEASQPLSPWSTLRPASTEPAWANPVARVISLCILVTVEACRCTPKGR